MKNKNRKWTQRDGTKIRLCDMDSQHLWNTYALMNRNELVQIKKAFDYGAKAAEFEHDTVIQKACRDAINSIVDGLSSWPDRLRQELDRRRQAIREDVHAPIHTREKAELLRDIDSLVEHKRFVPIDGPDMWDDDFQPQP